MNSEQIILTTLALDEPQHIRKLARETCLNPNTIKNVCNKLQKNGILELNSNTETGRVEIQFAENSIAKHYKRMHAILYIYESGLIDSLIAHFEQPTIILFGSFAKAENHTNSDIDLCIISEQTKEFSVTKFETKLKRPIQLFIHTQKSFNKLRKSSPHLVNNMINGIYLHGFIEVIDETRQIYRRKTSN